MLSTRQFARSIAALAAGGLLLTGCSGGSASDRSGRSGPGPAYVLPDGGSRSGGGGTAGVSAGTAGTGPGAADGAPEGEDDGIRSPAPPADYLSTFALDVDTAGYGFARRSLADGRLPAPETVRPEEFVNSFRQDYPRPDGNGFAVAVDGARLAGSDGWSLVRVGLTTGPAARGADRRPAALTFVVDISGSMAETGRLDLVRTAMGLMTDRLRSDDSVAVVAFSDQAETRLPMTRLDGNRQRVHEVVDGLLPSRSTNVEAGVVRGYEVAVAGLRPGATNRVVLLSDALANTGATTADAILDRIDDARRRHGITLSGVGVGSDYGDALMERLADHGDGHTTYIADQESARRVFCEDLPAQIDLRARDAKAQVAFDPQTVERFRLIGYEDRKVADEDFRDDAVDGGEVGPGHTVTALYAVRTRPGAAGHLATATVRWLDPRTRAPHEASGTVEAAALHGDLWERAPARLQVTAVAAYFASALREASGGWEPLPGALPLDALARRAEGLAARTEDADVVRLSEAVRQAAGLRR
ncbi:von Willebrand factor type A domain-containing protein [Streptomyces sp. NPDC093225]|uniref:vWA domain-containing protein n=1 Tax=Streptomyces sp. NPDC093225 TaxID=3366034 RepID=UPI00381D7918